MPEALFRVKVNEKILYLTFDDGPDPDSTPQLLEILNACSVKVTFFCSGKSAEKYPELITHIKSSGHLTGNHGYDHRNGWKTNTSGYVADVEKASAFTSDRIFRPPYGRITLRQRRRLRDYKLVFWDIMAYDFDSTLNDVDCLKIITKKMRPGSIIILHDTPASCANRITGTFIAYALSKGYCFGLIG